MATPPLSPAPASAGNQTGINLPPFPSFDCLNDIHAVGQRWKKYLGRFENFTSALGIAEDRKQRAMLLHYVGEETYDLFETLANTGTTYSEAVNAFNLHFTPLVNVEFEMYTFRQMKQMDQELVEQYHTRLRKASALCQFQNAEREIKSQIIVGCKDNKLRKHALRTPTATLAEILNYAKTMEVSEKHSLEIESHVTQDNVNANHDERGEVNYVNSRRKIQNKTGPGSNKSIHYRPKTQQTNNASKQCKNCGGIWHEQGRQQCPAFGKQCHKCSKQNHFAKVCLSDKHKPQKQEERKTGAVATIIDSSQDSWGKQNFVYSNCTLTSIKDKIGLITLNICETPITFLIDSGASVNVLGKQDYDKIKHKPKLMKITNFTYPYGQNKPIEMLGKFEHTFHVNNKQTTDYIQVGAGNAISLLSKQTSLGLGLIQFINNAEHIDIRDYDKYIQDNFPKIFDGLGKCENIKVKLHVDEKIQPIYNKHRRIPFHLRDLVEAELSELEKANVIEKLPENTPTPWVSPIVIVPKKDKFNAIRICVDMRGVNKAILRERHPTPTLDEIIQDLNEAKHFSKIDLKQGYHQLELDEDSRYLTVFSTHLGLYRYKRLNFGINAAAERFQEAIQTIIQHIPGVINISDDILVFGQNKKEHDQSLIKLLTTLNNRNLTLNKDKCIFDQDKLKFYGHIFSSQGIKASPERIEEIKNITKPKDLAELRSLLGMITFCSRYIPSLADMSEPLRRLTKKYVMWAWTDEQDKAFKAIVQKLEQNITLAYFDKKAETEIWTDASPVGISGILVQRKQERMTILACASRMLSDPETRYAQIEREALAITWAVEHFKIYTHGAHFKVITDHLPLVSLFNNPYSNLSARMERWRLRLLPFDFEVDYKAGKENPADYLSRKPCLDTKDEHKISESADRYAHLLTVMDVPLHISLEEVKQETKKDPMLNYVIKSIQTKFHKHPISSIDQSTYNKYYRVRHELITNYEGTVVLKGRKIVIPTSLQERAIDLAHQSHSGIVKTKQLIRSKVWFPGINAKVEDKVKHCIKCQTVTRSETKMPLKSTILPDGPWDQIQIDHKGPLPTGDYLLVITDLYSRFPLVEIVRSTNSQENIGKLEHIFEIFGTPKQVCTDNGPPYNSHEFSKFLQRLDIKHRKVTPNWPQANGGVERFNRHLNKTLQLAFTYAQDWKKELWKMLKIYRATPHSTTQVSPAELMYNRPFRIGLPAIDNTKFSPIINRERVEPKDRKSKEYQQQYHDSHHKLTKTPSIGDKVLVKQRKMNKMNTWYEPIPYTVTKVHHSMITAKKPGKQITRDASYYKTIPDSSESDQEYKRLRTRKMCEEEPVNDPDQEETPVVMDPETSDVDQELPSQPDGNKGHYLRKNIRPPERLIEHMNFVDMARECELPDINSIKLRNDPSQLKRKRRGGVMSQLCM